jgi:GH3 auxin-responsive promoter
MSLLVKMLFAAIGPRTLEEFGSNCAAPMLSQRRLLEQIIGENQSAAYGKRYGFASLKGIRDFQERVPIASYEALQPYVENAMGGAKGQLTSQTPSFYAMTSGTTGLPKYIPVTPGSRVAKSKLMKIWLSAVFRDHPGIFSGKILQVVSPEVEERTLNGIPMGSESGHAYRNMPAALKKMYALPYDVYEIKSYEAKYYTLLRLAVCSPISVIATVNPSTVLLLAKHLGEHTEQIIRDVRDGTLRPDLALPDSIRQGLERDLKSDPVRAAALEKAAGKGDNKLEPREVWPDMQMISCWKGGTVGQYLKQFDSYYKPGLPVRDLGYLSSEHRGSVPISDEGDAGVLAIPTNFYEFFPADVDRKPGGKELLTVDELEEGKQYFVYITTLGGLYRYDMNDIIEVTGRYHNTPVIRFVQKGKGVVSFTGEKLYETQVLAAVEDACSETSPQAYEFIAAVGMMDNDRPRYVFLIEYAEPITERKVQETLQRIEQGLRQRNIEYAAKRDSLRIAAPVLRVVRKGASVAYRKRMVEQKGRADGQFKILRLTSDASFAEEFESVRDHVAQA